MRTCFIYALCEPGTRTVRYIGKTFDLKRRLGAHVRTSSKHKSHLGHWLHGIVVRGEVPDMITLREVPEVESDAEEIRYIRIARESLGMNLVNGTAGGEGGVTMTPAENSLRVCGAKNPMFGKHHSWESRKKMSIAMTGKGLGKRLGSDNPRFGKHNSPEHREKLSISGKAAWARRKEKQKCTT